MASEGVPSPSKPTDASSGSPGSISRATLGPPARAGLERRRSLIRYGATRLLDAVLVRAYVRIRVHGTDRLPRGPYVLCFNHQSWADPFLLLAVLPWAPRIFVFGPKESDMSRGWRNRVMSWTGTPLPYRPSKNDLISATRRVDAVLDSGGMLAIAGEGRIHAGESVLLPLSQGAAFFALHSGVPIVPCAINGSSWLCFGRTIRIRFGQPLAVEGRPTQSAVEELTDRLWHDLHALCQGYPDPSPPGRFGRWFTELFNEWPEGARPSPPDEGEG